jgi:hypothetical protein
MEQCLGISKQIVWRKCPQYRTCLDADKAGLTRLANRIGDNPERLSPLGPVLFVRLGHRKDTSYCSRACCCIS